MNEAVHQKVVTNPQQKTKVSPKPLQRCQRNPNSRVLIFIGFFQFGVAEDMLIKLHIELHKA